MDHGVRGGRVSWRSRDDEPQYDDHRSGRPRGHPERDLREAYEGRNLRASERDVQDSRDGYYQHNHNRYRDGAHVDGSPLVSGPASPHSGGGRSFMGALAAMNI